MSSSCLHPKDDCMLDIEGASGVRVVKFKYWEGYELRLHTLAGTLVKSFQGRSAECFLDSPFYMLGTG
ncbi:hypothetical protein EMIT0158MI4_80101 [Burkholderia ambifaria]